MTYSFSQIRHAVLAAKNTISDILYGEKIMGSRLEEIRSAPHLQSYLEEIRSEAVRAHNTPLSTLPFSVFIIYEATGSRHEFQELYFERRRRLAALVLASVVDETDEYMRSLENVIWEMCNEYAWSLPAHLPRGLEECMANRLPPEQVVDLFAAETAHALAETLVLLGERLNPWIHYRISTEIEKRIFKPVFHSPVRFSWESVRMNWSAVCAGSVGMAALILVDDRERLAGMIDRIIRAMECFLEGYGEDGGCPEGIGYWNYGFGYYVYFSEMINAFTDGAIDLLQDGTGKIRNIAGFPAGIGLSDNRFINYSDAPERFEINTGLICRLSMRFNQNVPEMKKVTSFYRDASYRLAHLTRNLFWTEPALLNQPVAEGTVYYPNIGWIIDRRRVQGKLIAFSAKGGHNEEPHNHNDLGHFIIHVGGQNLLADLGQGHYSSEYFGPNRYQLLHPSSAGHSVPIIEGQYQKKGKHHQASIIRSEIEEPGLTFAMDLTRAYDVAALSKYVRTFKWKHDGEEKSCLHIIDDFCFTEKPSVLQEIFISLHQPVVEAGSVVWQGKQGRIVLNYDRSRFQAHVEDLPSQIFNDPQTVVYRLWLQAINPQEHEVFHFTLACGLQGNGQDELTRRGDL
jgi:hypothetical protein